MRAQKIAKSVESTRQSKLAWVSIFFHPYVGKPVRMFQETFIKTWKKRNVSFLVVQSATRLTKCSSCTPQRPEAVLVFWAQSIGSASQQLLLLLYQVANLVFPSTPSQDLISTCFLGSFPLSQLHYLLCRMASSFWWLVLPFLFEYKWNWRSSFNLSTFSVIYLKSASELTWDTSIFWKYQEYCLLNPTTNSQWCSTRIHSF